MTWCGCVLFADLRSRPRFARSVALCTCALPESKWFLIISILVIMNHPAAPALFPLKQFQKNYNKICIASPRPFYLLFGVQTLYAAFCSLCCSLTCALTESKWLHKFLIISGDHESSRCSSTVSTQAIPEKL